MAVYEVTMVFPNVPYDENCRRRPAAANLPPLRGFRQIGDGVALTFVITTNAGTEVAIQMGRQRAEGLWSTRR